MLPEIVVGIGRPVQTGDPQRSDVEGEQVTHGDAHLLRRVARDDDLHGRGGRAALEIVIVTRPRRRRSPVGDLHVGLPVRTHCEPQFPPDDPRLRSDDLHLVAISGRDPLRRVEQRGQRWAEARGCALDRVGDRGQPLAGGTPAPGRRIAEEAARREVAADRRKVAEGVTQLLARDARQSGRRCRHEESGHGDHERHQADQRSVPCRLTSQQPHRAPTLPAAHVVPSRAMPVAGERATNAA